MIESESANEWLCLEVGKLPRVGKEPFCAEPLELVLQRERARSDRTDRVFSLLVFHLTSEHVRQGGEARLAAILARRLRIMDYMGRLGDSRLGVVLPETPPSGAQTLAGYVQREFGGDPPRCDIYAYPTKYTSDDDAPLQGRNGHSPRADEVSESREPAETAHADRNGHPVEACWDDGSGMNRTDGVRVGSGQSRGDAIAVRPMELLFSRPLPAWKRWLDIIAAAVGLVLTAPIMLAAAVAIKCTSRGPVFFTQPRAGLGGKPFRLYKLRTMCVDAEAAKAKMRQYSEQDGPAFKMKNDPRVTRIGRFLRGTSLDELPQFWNVLRGDMSLVGPRPLPCDESAQCRPWQRRRLDVTPGLTCIWQVSGRSSVSFDEWMRMDVTYVRSRTLLHDLKLILLTIPAVLLQRGAH